MRSGALPIERIRGVQTGGCPHTAIREDTSINHEALDEMRARSPTCEIVFLESGGDNLAASFSPELVDVSIYVVDVAGGDKVPRKGGPGVTRSDLLVINKIDLAPNVGADLGVMARDAAAIRGGKPVVFTNLKRGDGLDEVIDWIRRDVLFEIPESATDPRVIAGPAAAASRLHGRRRWRSPPAAMEPCSRHAEQAAPLKIVRPFPLAGGGLWSRS